MDCLQIRIPPLPQFITIGHSVWKPGDQHFERQFSVFDMLLVLKGTLYMTEDDHAYAIEKNDLLVLEPGRFHYGHKACEEDTEIFWVHFFHPYPAASVAEKQIRWSSPLPTGTDQDHQPGEQRMFIPKWANIDSRPLLPTLQDMLQLQSMLNEGNALMLQSLLAKLLSQLQDWLHHTIKTVKPSRSLTLSLQMEDFLRGQIGKPFHLDQLERQFHFNAEYLARCLKKHTGMTPLQYVHFLMIEEAKKLLAGSEESVSQIAGQLGVADYNYFIRLFRHKTGMTPGEYRASRQGVV